MYSTRLFPMAVPVTTAGISAFGNWAAVIVSVLGLLCLLLAVRSLRLRSHAAGTDHVTGGPGA